MYIGQAAGTKPWNSVTRTNGTDNAVVRFDGTNGEVQNSSATIDDTGVLTTAGISITTSAVLPSTTTIGNVSSTELSYLDGVTAPIQTQLTTKQNSLLVAEYVVTGSAVTSIDFSGLDINTHKSYRVEISIANATANSSGLYCFINGDTNLTNYYRELVQFDGTTIGANRANNPQIITLQPSSSLSLTSNVQRGDNGYARAINFGNSSNGSSVLKEDSTLIKTATVANITQLTFITSVAGAIGIGSKIRIYRGDS